MKRLNLPVNTEIPEYQRAYDYIMEHQREKWKFVANCVLAFVEGKIPVKEVSDREEIIDLLLKDEDFINAIALKINSVATESNKNVGNFERKATEHNTDSIETASANNKSAESNEVKQPSYDGPIVADDLLAGLDVFFNQE